MFQNIEEADFIGLIDEVFDKVSLLGKWRTVEGQMCQTVCQSSQAADPGQSSQTADPGQSSQTAGPGQRSQTAGPGQSSWAADPGHMSQAAAQGSQAAAQGILGAAQGSQVAAQESQVAAQGSHGAAQGSHGAAQGSHGAAQGSQAVDQGSHGDGQMSQTLDQMSLGDDQISLAAALESQADDLGSHGDGQMTATDVSGSSCNSETAEPDEKLDFHLGKVFSTYSIFIMSVNTDLLYHGILLMSQKYSTRFGDGEGALAFWKNSIGDYHQEKKVHIQLLSNFFIPTYFSQNIESVHIARWQHVLGAWDLKFSVMSCITALLMTKARNINFRKWSFILSCSGLADSNIEGDLKVFL